MRIKYWSIYLFLRAVTDTFLRIYDEELAKIPEKGPLIFVINHINIFEIPVLYTRLQPRKVTAFVRHDAWDTMFAPILNFWRAIPVQRGKPDLAAFRRGVEMLDEGYLLGLAPEGTRSNHGRLQEAHPGVVLLAMKSNAPIYPVACYGHEKYRQEIKRLRRAEFNIKVGSPFRLNACGQKVDAQIRKRMLEAIMYQLVKLMPSQYAGLYAIVGEEVESYLEYL
jgi:1-acyl-sn-glycerol-3-phosphate acyltransferase